MGARRLRDTRNFVVCAPGCARSTWPESKNKLCLAGAPSVCVPVDLTWAAAQQTCEQLIRGVHCQFLRCGGHVAAPDTTTVCYTPSTRLLDGVAE
jgi:hypothetical protein